MNPHQNTAKNLRDARDKAGVPSYRDMERRVYDLLGGYAPSSETIRAYHSDPGPGSPFPKQPDPILLAALAEVYDVELRDIDAETADYLSRVRDLLGRSSLWIRDGQLALPVDDLASAA